MGFLYKLDFASGKSYIGITFGTMRGRMHSHKCDSKTRSQYAVHRAWRKHGEPVVTVLAIASGDFLRELERRAVAAYGTYGSGGYNMTPGGEIAPPMTPERRAKLSLAMIGKKHSQETRALMSVVRKGEKRPPRSAEHRERLSTYAKTRVFTPEQRVRMAASRIGLKRSQETKGKTSASLTGRTFSIEHRIKLSAAAKGRSFSGATRAKMAENMRNRPITSATRQRLSDANKGRKHTPEHRAANALCRWRQQHATIQWTFL